MELGAGLSGVGLRLDLAAGLSGVDLRLDFLAGVGLGARLSVVDLRLDLVTALLGAQVDLLVGGDSTVFSGESEMLTISWSTSWSVDNRTRAFLALVFWEEACLRWRRDFLTGALAGRWGRLLFFFVTGPRFFFTPQRT